MSQRVLLGDPDAGLGAAAQAIYQAKGSEELLPIDDGAKLLSVLARLLKMNQPPLLIILEARQRTLTGAPLARAIRALERGLGHAPSPILFYTSEPPDPAFKALVGELGCAVHLQKSTDLPVGEQARRMAVAARRILAQRA